MIRKYAYDLAFQTETERLAFMPQVSDVGKVAKQLSDNSYWTVRGDGPFRWERVPTEASGGHYRPMVKVYERIVPLTSANNANVPGHVFFNEEVDLEPWGLLATTYQFANFGFVIEKPDGQGGWTPTLKPVQVEQLPPSLQVANDPEGYITEVAIVPGTPLTPLAPDGDVLPSVFMSPVRSGSEWGRDWDHPITYAPDPATLSTRARVIIRAGSDAWTPEEVTAFDALGYRLRVAIYGINLVVWEREVAIPVTDGVILLDESIFLSDYGASSRTDQMRFLAEIRRDGKTIKKLNFYSVAGEAGEHPSYPVVVKTVGVAPGNDPRNDNNNGGGFNGRHIDQGVDWGAEVGFCADSVKDEVRVSAWRDGPIRQFFVDGSAGHRVARVRVGGQDKIVATGTATGSAGWMFDVLPLGTEPMSVVLNGTGGVSVRYPNGSTWGQIANAITASGLSIPFEFTVSNPAEVAPTDWTLVTAVYRDGDEVPTTPALAEGCTLRVRLLVAPPYLVGFWPFNYGTNESFGRFVYPLSPLAPPDADPNIGWHPHGSELWVNRDDGALWLGARPVGLPKSYTTATRPAPDFTWHRCTIAVKDPGVDEMFQICRQRADGSYEWVAIPID